MSDADATATPDDPSGASAPRGGGVRRSVVALAFVLAFVLVFGLVVWYRSREPVAPPGYDARTRHSFVTECVNNGGPSYEPVCECAFDRIAASVPFERYVELDRRARAARVTTVPPGTAATPATGAPAGTAAPSGTAPPADSPVADDAIAAAITGCLDRKIRGSAGSTTPGVPRTATSVPSTLALVPEPTTTVPAR